MDRPYDESRFTSEDGLPIACVRWTNNRPVNGIVQIAHGLGEHVRRYAETAAELVSAGFAVYGNDHRGHGRSAASVAQMGEFGAGGFELLLADMVRLSGIAKAEHPGRPLILLGHGMGSFAAQLYVLDHSDGIDGLVLSGTGALDELALVARSVPVGTNVLNMAFMPGRTSFDWLTRDRDIVDAFIMDPLCFAELQPAAFASLLAAAPGLCDPIRLRGIRPDLPIYLFSGAEDPVGQHLEGLRLVIDRYRKAGVRDVSYDFYPGGRHEMLGELNRKEVRSRLLRWLLSHLG